MDSHNLKISLGALVNAANPIERADALRLHADDLLSTEAMEVLSTNRERANAEGDVGAVEVFESVQRLLAICMSEGLEAGLQHLRREERSRALRDFVNAQDWITRKQLVTAWPDELLGPEAAETLESMLASRSDAPIVAGMLRECADVLNAVRERGVAAAFAGIRERMIEQIGEWAANAQREEADTLILDVRALTEHDERPQINGQIIRQILDRAPLSEASSWAEEQIQMWLDHTDSRLSRGWAHLHAGSVYLDLLDRNANDFVELAIVHLEQALDLFSSIEGLKMNGVYGSLGRAYLLRSAGDTLENSEIARKHFEQELAVTDRYEDTDTWGMTQCYLGIALFSLGERKQAGAHLAEGLKARVSGQTDLEPLTKLLLLLTQTQAADRVVAVEDVLSDLEGVAAGMPKGSPELGDLHIMFSDVYRRDRTGDPGANLDAARSHIEEALKVFDRAAHPDQWAKSQHNLGTVYYDEMRGERSDNIEQAIACYRRALSVHTKEDFPDHFALTSSALGMALIERQAGDRSANLTHALQHLEAAESILDRQSSKQVWAECHTAMGAIYRLRVAPDRVENLRRALHHFEGAHRAYVELDDRQRIGQVLSNLSAVYIDLADFDDTALSRAEAAAEESAQIVDRATDPYHWAIARRNLAAVLSRSRDAPERVERALNLLEQALEVFVPEHYMAEYRSTKAYEGHLFFDRGEWESALKSYEDSAWAGEQLLASAYTEPGRQNEVVQTQLFYPRAAYCWIRLGRLDRALETLEAGKTRLLAESLALSDTDIIDIPSELVVKLRTARDDIRRGEQEMRRRVGRRIQASAEIGTRLREARATLSGIVQEIRRIRPDFLDFSLSADEIVRLAPKGGALVTLLVTDRESCAFVIESGAAELETRHLLTLPLQKHHLDGLLDDARPDTWIAYLRGADTIRSRSQFRRWRSELIGFGDWLWDVVVGPIYERLCELGVAPGSPVLVLPQGGLSLLPLHGASRTDGGMRRHLADDFAVSYAPGAFWRKSCEASRDRLKMERSKLLAVVDPRSDLAFARQEVAQAAAYFPDATMLVGPEATHKNVVEAALRATHIHFACHAAYDWDDVMRSYLELADPDTLTLSDVLAGELALKSTRLVSLSACETGVTEYRVSPDEYIGLPAAFTTAGAAGVVSSLWKVDDASTSLLMGRFYQELATSNPADALFRSQQWVRGLTAADISRFEPNGGALIQHYGKLFDGFGPDDRILDEPFFWAGFIFTGA